VDAFLGPVLRLRASEEGEWYALLMTRGINESAAAPLLAAFITGGMRQAMAISFAGQTV
jgi:hypothetical protein